MANNELLVQSGLQTLQKQPEMKKQAVTDVAPAFPVSGEPKSATATSESLEQTKEQKEVLQEKVAQLNDHMQNLKRTLQFSVDESSGESIVKVIDSTTKELIRQIPSQELLDIQNAAEKYRGILLETKV